MTSPQPLRIGFIGAGGNTRLRHLPAFQGIPGVECVAVCNRSMASGEAIAKQFGIASVTTDPAAIFDDPTIDAVCIGTWPYRHREYAIKALQSNKHVLCEARMAMDAAEAREMLAAAETSDRVAQLVPAPFDLRCGLTIRKLLDEGFVGRPVEVLVTAINGGGLASRNLEWRHRADYSGRNTMTMGIMTETVQRWLGDTTRVMAQARTVVDRRVDAETGNEVEVRIPDSLGILADMACGARATYLLSAVAPGAPSQGITVHGTEGSIAWVMGDRMSVAKAGQPLAPREPDPELVREWRVEADFVDSIREGVPVTMTSFADGLKYMEFTDAVWTSWNEGRAVDVGPTAAPVARA